MLEELETMKKKLEKARDQYSQLVGEQNLLHAQLKELGFDSLEEAEQALEKMVCDIENRTDEISQQVGDFKVQYEDFLND